MGLSASMWASVSGLQAHGDRMNVISNNIANVNTVGFKGSRMDFSDFMSQSIGTAAGIGQMGRGVRDGIVMGDFSQSAFETTNRTNDIAIQGNGFFGIRKPNSDALFYTRAGNFNWDTDGKLVSPEHYPVQGWRIDNTAHNQGGTTGTSSSTSTSIVGTGTPVDITLDNFTCPPQATTNMTLALNLDSSSGNDKSVNEDTPFFSLLTHWDATPDSNGNIQGLGTNARAWDKTYEVYDEAGQAHKITIYFDRVTQTENTNIDNLTNNSIEWEYIVTMDPSEDLRDFGSGGVPEKYKGLLMSGTLSFDAAGQMKDMTSYVPTSDDMGDLNTWVQAPISSNGYPLFNPNFSGAAGASSAWNAAETAVNSEADGKLIEFNLGMRSLSNTWSGTAPHTIADWTKYTGDSKAYKSSKKAGTVVDVSETDTNGTTTTVKGVVGADGKVYVPKAAADADSAQHEIADTTKNLVFKQKSTANGFTPGKNEVADANGWIYEQATTPKITGPDGTTQGSYPIVQDTTGQYYAYDATKSKYIKLDDANGTVSSGATWDNGPTTKVTKVASSTGVASDVAIATTTPRYKYDNQGNKIPETVTSVHTGMGTNSEHEGASSTSFKGTFNETDIKVNGYTYGTLQTTEVKANGVITGHYSNGKDIDLYQIALYDFASQQGLHREGGNMFSETSASGTPRTGAPGSGSLGTTAGNSLETSNVDLGKEFVYMITTQRGYQANSKSVTTVDTMLETVISMKR